MNTVSPSALAWRGAGLGPPGWVSAASVAPAAAAADRRAAAWFNEPLGDDSRILRAPVQPGPGDAQSLCQRFLACLTPEAA